MDGLILEMSEGTFQKETKEIVLSRLRLAQKLLEESDDLGGLKDYNYGGEKHWFHPRHEREALVVYLLLTCFDRLGQQQKHIDFGSWLISKKNKVYEEERQEVLNSLPPNIAPVDSAARHFEKYKTIYGVKNRFYRGIEELPEGAKKKLLDSVRLFYDPKFKNGENVSRRAFPIEDKKKEMNLKLQYLYEKRNRFTHKLDQYHSCSTPAMSNYRFQNGSSWVVFINGSRLSYMGVHEEHKILNNNGGAYVYDVCEWPFVLFEVIYSSLGIQFDRTTIKLKFQVLVFSADGASVTTYNNIEHKYLKSIQSFLDKVGQS